MNNMVRGVFSAILSLALTVSADSVVAGKIVCWKDKSGKTVGCGDTVPPEYQTSATKELDKHGVTRKTTESAAEQAAKIKTPGPDLSKQKEQQEEEQRKLAEQRRQNYALINTFSNEEEIDAKRDRELQTLELQNSQLKVSLKNAKDRQAAVNARSDAYEKGKKPVPANLKAEKAQAAEESLKIQQRIAEKEKEMAEIRVRYGDYRKRFTELKGAPQPAMTSAGTSVPKK
jgi:hypothetical protein